MKSLMPLAQILPRPLQPEADPPMEDAGEGEGRIERC